MTGDPNYDKIELFLNEMQADMQVCQYVLQNLIVGTLSASKNPQEILTKMTKQIHGLIESLPNSSDTVQDSAKLRLVIEARFDRFFQPIRRRFGLPTEGPPPEKIN